MATLRILLVLHCVCAAWGESCVTSFGLPGQCVVLEACPLLNALFEKPYLVRHESNLLLAAYGACPDELYCCGKPERMRTKTEKPRLEVDVRQENSIESEEVCLQNRLIEGFVGASSLATSFGVFITNGLFKNSRCVGSLITSEYVLTAAHCVPNNQVEVYVSARYVTGDEEVGLRGDVEKRYVREVIIHEWYSRKSRDNDIALLRLDATVPQEDSAPRPICIPIGPAHDPIASEGQTVKCFGWGVNAEGVPSRTKQWVTLERISQERCQARMDTLNRKLKLTDRSICTVTITGHDAFGGYSGGPLMYQKDGTWFLLGIVNYGVGETSNEFPVVSANVQQYTDWILSHIRRDK